MHKREVKVVLVDNPEKIELDKRNNLKYNERGNEGGLLVKSYIVSYSGISLMVVGMKQFIHIGEYSCILTYDYTFENNMIIFRENWDITKTNPTSARLKTKLAFKNAFNDHIGVVYLFKKYRDSNDANDKFLRLDNFFYRLYAETRQKINLFGQLKHIFSRDFHDKEKESKLELCLRNLYTNKNPNIHDLYDIFLSYNQDEPEMAFFNAALNFMSVLMILDVFPSHPENITVNTNVEKLNIDDKEEVRNTAFRVIQKAIIESQLNKEIFTINKEQ